MEAGLKALADRVQLDESQPQDAIKAIRIFERCSR